MGEQSTTGSELWRCPHCGGELTGDASAHQAADSQSRICVVCSSRFPVVASHGYFYSWDEYAPQLLLRVYYDFLLTRDQEQIPEDLKERLAGERPRFHSILQAAWEEAKRELPSLLDKQVLYYGPPFPELVQELGGQRANCFVGSYSPYPYLYSFDELNGGKQPVFFSSPLRLPFAEGAFEVVICPPLLHYVRGDRECMRELARVLRPGGTLVLLAQPMRAFLGRTPSWELGGVEDYLANTARVSYALEMPLNLSYCGYRRAFYQQIEPERSVRRRLRPLRFTLRYLKRAALISFVAERGKSKMNRRRARPPSVRLDPNELVLDLEEKAGEAERILPQLFSNEVSESRLDFCRPLAGRNCYGWRARESLAGEMIRYPLHHAFFFLRRRKNEHQLVVSLLGIPNRYQRKYFLRIWVNGTELELPELIKPGWRVLKLELPQELKDPLFVHLQQSTPFSLQRAYRIEDPRHVGIAVRALGLE